MTRTLGNLIVKPYLLPISTYASPVWGHLAVVHQRKLESVLDMKLRLAAKASYK